MSLSVGIVGLPNAGKSTLFNALVSRRLAPVGVHPFTTVKPNTGVVRLSDTRLDKLSKALKPKKTTPTSVTFIDIAGLVKGAHEGEGLGNEFLAYIRGVDVICHVVREFSNANVAHVMGAVDPLRDREVVLTELGLKDLETLERAKKGKRKDKDLQTAVGKLINALNKDLPASSAQLKAEEQTAIGHIQLLTDKPVFYVMNVTEEDLEELKKEVKKLAKKLEESVIVCAKLEEELIDLEESERSAYRREMGLRGSGLDKVISKAYDLLNLITFYTVKGVEPPSAKASRGRGKGEVRAWSIERGSSALDAAERVHTDFARGFINAEVIDVSRLLKYSNFQAARAAGKVRQEGRGYKIKDGDVVEFKTSL